MRDHVPPPPSLSPTPSPGAANGQVFSRNATPNSKQSAAAKLIELTSRVPTPDVRLIEFNPRREIAHCTQKFRPAGSETEVVFVVSPDRVLVEFAAPLPRLFD